MRKNIGYLFAIQNGAKFIYDTDNNNCPIMKRIEINRTISWENGLDMFVYKNQSKGKLNKME